MHRSPQTSAIDRGRTPRVDAAQLDHFLRLSMRRLLPLSWLLVALSLLAEVTALGDTSPTNGAPVRNLLILGDSLAAGFGVDPEQAWPARLQARIREAGLRWQVINAGVSGDTSAGGLRRLDWQLRRPVDVLLLELGGNDGLRGLPPAATRTNLQAILDRTRARWPRSRAVIAGMQMPSNMGHDYTSEFQALFPTLAATNDALLIPFLLEGVGGRPELNLPDQIHPNPTGHELVASNVWQIMRPLLSGPAVESSP
jgi:acyl-CoA thioesterase I